MNMPTATTTTNTIKLSLINFDALVFSSVVGRFTDAPFLFIIVKLPLGEARTSYPLVVLEPPS